MDNSTLSVSAEDLGARIECVLDERIRLRNMPATDEQLARIWPAWNACPADVLPDERRHILTNDPLLGNEETFRVLKSQFPDLPFDEDKYCQAFGQVELWCKLIDYAKSTERLHVQTAEQHWEFKEYNGQAEGRLAIWRAVREMAVSHPGSISKSAPTLAEIQHLVDRYQAYLDARTNALDEVAAIIYKIPGITDATSPFRWDKHGLGGERLRDDVPPHLYYARLDALKICSPHKFEEFIRKKFLTLTREERQDFYHMSLATGHRKESHAALKVWLLDNIPIFKIFDWRWAEIHTAAQRLGLLDLVRHRNHQSLGKWASRQQLTWGMKTGVGKHNRDETAFVESTSPLLSPRPVFDHILKCRRRTT